MELIKGYYAEKKRVETLLDDIGYDDHNATGFFETWELFNDCVSYFNNLGTKHIYCFKYDNNTVVLNSEFIYEYPENKHDEFLSFIKGMEKTHTIHIDFEL